MYTKFSGKLTFPTSWNISFSETFAYVLSEWSLIFVGTDRFHGFTANLSISVKISGQHIYWKFSVFFMCYFLFDKTATGVRLKKWSSKIKSFLTYFSPRFHYYTPRKRSENFGFLTFSGGIEMDHWAKMG